MGRKAKAPVREDQLVHLKVVRQVLGFRTQLLSGAVHGHTRRERFDTLIVLLAAFFNPTVRSLRLVEQRSQIPWVQRKLSVRRVCRSTLSDAFQRFAPEQRVPLLTGLMRQVPALRQRDADLATICQQVVAADGALFTLAGEVAWALRQSRTNGRPLSQPRLDLQLDTASFTPVDMSVQGSRPSEAATLIARLQPGGIYLLDRNYVPFGLLEAIFKKGSDVVLRLRGDTNFTVTTERALTPRDRAAGVLSDRVGVLPGSGGHRGGRSRTAIPPQRALREVRLQDPDGGTPVRLLTSLLDVPADVIGALYRQRWQIELFFRWLKVVAGFGHLLSQSAAGITIELYVAVIGCLLLYLRTGMPVNKYTVFVLGQVAAGLLEFKDALPMLQRSAREKALEKARLLRKKLAAAS